MNPIIRVVDVMSNNVIKVNGSASVFETLSKIVRFGVGSIVVVRGQEVVGIVTKGDVLAKAMLAGLDPMTTSVTRIMSTDVVTITRDATLEEASRLMSEKKVSKLPVVEDSKLVGIITSTDIIKAEPMMVGYLHELIRARFVPHELTAR